VLHGQQNYCKSEKYIIKERQKFEAIFNFVTEIPGYGSEGLDLRGEAVASHFIPPPDCLSWQRR
jgi:hypothetical protein